MMFASKLSSAALDAWRGEKSRIALGICDLSNATVSSSLTMCLSSAFPMAIPIATAPWSVMNVVHLAILRVAMTPLVFPEISETLHDGVVECILSVSD
jgi:hypothetical protein